jgi:hypothetical protein
MYPGKTGKKLMSIFGSIRKENGPLFCILALSCVFFFAANAVDLRDELQIIDSPYSSLDNVSTAVQSNFSFETPRSVICGYLTEKSSVAISFFHFLPYSNRAPPAWS